MRSTEIFDADQELQDVRRVRRLRRWRLGAPIASIALMIGGLLGIAFYSYNSNRQDTLALSRDLMVALEARVKMEVASYLRPAEDAARALQAALVDQPFSDANRDLVERFGMHLLREKSQIALISIADPLGNYLMLRPNPFGGIDTKLMERTPDRLTTTWFRRQADGTVSAVEQDPNDTFDPRTRPWFRDAIAADDVAWTDVYVFFTDKKPGITISLPVKDRDGKLTAVVGVDIYLDQLNAFLQGLHISPNGQSLIVDSKGQVIAASRKASVFSEGEEPRLSQVSELGDSDTTEAYDRLRISGASRSMVDIDQQSFIIVGSSLADVVARDWMLMFVVPESDFVGFVSRNTRTALYMSAGLLPLVLALAALLIRQSVNGERMARALSRRERDMVEQERAFAELSDTAAVFDIGRPESVRRVTEVVCRFVKASGVRLWQFEGDRESALCLDAYDHEAKGHTAGTELTRRQIPELFESVTAGRPFTADNVLTDERLASIRGLYPPSANPRSLVVLPIGAAGQVSGHLAMENMALTGEERDTAVTLVATYLRLLAPRLPLLVDERREAGWTEPLPMVADAGAALSPIPTTAMRAVSIGDARQRLALRDFAARDRGAVSAIFPQTTVLVLKLFDDAAMGAGDADQDAGLAHIVDVASAACNGQGVKYLKILGDQILVADGYEGDSAAAAARIGDIALTLRENCAAIFRHRGRTPQFAIGLDTGTVIGASLAEDTVYNLWGDALRIAHALAATAQPGTIQATQTTYHLLNDRFLFRRAGAYYLAKIGEMNTYTLRGHL